MNSMIQDMDNCTYSAGRLYTQLSVDHRLSNIISLQPDVPGHHCFRAKFLLTAGAVSKIGSYGFSMSFPMDANRGEPVPSTIETALLKLPQSGNIESANLTYVSSVGYDDICRFSNTDELVEEIIRVFNFLSSPDFEEGV